MKRYYLTTIIILVAFFFFGFSSPQKKDKEKVRLWNTGLMFQEEVIGKSGDVWMGLFYDETGFMLAQTTVSLIDSLIIDEHWKFAQTNISKENIFLIRGLSGLEPGVVKTVFYGNMRLEPGTSISFSLSADLSGVYEFYANGDVDGERINNFTVALHCDETYQVVFKRSVTNRGVFPDLLWAGDVDRDGKLDLLIDIPSNVDTSEPTLFLSSKADSAKLVKKVASFKRMGC